MENTGLIDQVEEFLSDPELVELCGRLRTGGDVLDVIELVENQHSDVFAWLLDPREGHGQGDQPLRDLLIAASRVVNHAGLDGRSSTARFFKEWPASRIQTAAFGSAFTVRELGMKASERVDLFVIDTFNRFVLLIENKANARHSAVQLDKYRSSFAQTCTATPWLRDFRQVHIALDRKFEEDDWADRPAASFWLHIGYDWLSASSQRAQSQVQRGNSEAGLVVSYCNHQIDGENESPGRKKALQLAISLHQSHGPAIKHLLGMSVGRMESDWLKDSDPGNSHLFMLQNRGVVKLLRETQGMALVETAVLAQVPGLTAQHVCASRAWADICPPGWEVFEGEEWWPVFMTVWYSDESKSKFDLRLVWNRKHARTPKEADDLRALLARVEPEFGKLLQTQRRRVVLGRSLGVPALVKLVAETNSRLAVALNAHLSK